MKTALGWMIVLLGIAVIGVDQYRIIATQHDFHWMPIASGTLLMLVGMYPDRVVAILERIAPAAMARWAERRTGEHSKPASVGASIICTTCGDVFVGTGVLCPECLAKRGQ